MIWLTHRLVQDFNTWERWTRIAFGIALTLLIVGLIAVLASPQEIRGRLVIGFGALILVTQLIVLWGNRGMVSSYTQAQQHYLAGDLEAARHILERARTTGKANMRALTLLGNTYRQLGMLAESEAVLYEALDKVPDHYFPLYNFGRTLLSGGRFAEASDAIQRALDLGAPRVTQFDLAEALYLNGMQEQATQLLIEVMPILNEPYRALMTAWWLHELGVGEPPNRELIAQGLPYWEAAAQRFNDTIYGQRIAQTVRALQNFTVESKDVK
jgi:tetratricopeptide (TPR) repeat protein